MNEKGHKNNLAKSSVWNLLSSILAKFGTLVFTIILARVLLPESFGIYSIAISIMTIVFTMFDLGLNQSLVKFYSEKLGKNKHEAAAYYNYISGLKYKLTIVSSLFLLIAAYPLSTYVFENQRLFLPLVFSSLYLFIFSIDSFYIHLFYSLKKVNQVAIREIINQVSKIVILLGLFSIFEREQYVSAAIITSIIAYAISVLYLFYHKGKLASKYSGKKININKKEIYRFAIYVYLANIANSLLFYIDSLILGVYVNPSFVGYYKSAFSLVLGVTGIGMAPVLIILPYLMSMNNKNQEKIVVTYSKLIALFSIPASFGMIVLGKYFLTLFFGVEYLPGYSSLALLSLLIFPQIIVSSLFFNMCSARNSPHLFFKNVVATMCVNIILNFILIKTLISYSELAATTGAGIAAVVSWTFYFVYSMYIMRSKFKIRIGYGLFVKPILASLFMSLVLVYINMVTSDMTLVLGFFTILAGALVYFIAIYLLNYLNKEEVDKIIASVRR